MPTFISANAQFNFGLWLVVDTTDGRELVAPQHEVSGRPGMPATDLEVARFIVRRMGGVTPITCAKWAEAWGARVFDPLGDDTAWELFDDLSHAESYLFPTVWDRAKSVREVAAVLRWSEHRVRRTADHLRRHGVELSPLPRSTGRTPRRGHVRRPVLT